MSCPFSDRALDDTAILYFDVTLTSTAFTPLTAGYGAGPFTIRTTYQDGTVKTDTNIPLNGNVEDA